MEIEVLKKLEQKLKEKDKTQKIILDPTLRKNTIKINRSKKINSQGFSYSTGKRKNSIARAWVTNGKGSIVINNKNYKNYFKRDSYKSDIIQPFKDTDTVNKYNVYCTVYGGGTSGQTGAIVHAISKALDSLSPNLHSSLKANKLLTRDSRIVERKKYGKRKARKSTQFSKR